MTDDFTSPLGDYAPDLGDTPEVVLTVSEQGVAEVLIDRAAKKNAFNKDIIAGLHRAFQTLHGADHVRAVFLRGAGAAFSAGADVEWMREQGEQTEADNRADAMSLARMLKALHDVPALTVALVQGPAMGGGAGLVAACDMAFATADASFAFSEVRLGLTPATISPYVVAAIGPRRARALFATGARFDAAYAEEIGLIDEVVEDLDAERDRIADVMAACAPGAVADAKRLVDLVHGQKIDRGLMEETARRIGARRSSEEGREGLAAFLGKRKPNWAQ